MVRCGRVSAGEVSQALIGSAPVCFGMASRSMPWSGEVRDSTESGVAVLGGVGSGAGMACNAAMGYGLGLFGKARVCCGMILSGKYRFGKPWFGTRKSPVW